jgi:archaellum biogenesis protein FlaJ (TadC family)
MQDADLFLELAAIAGVFVGFGALIAVRSSGASPDEVGLMRGVVSFGLLTVFAALAPVAISRYAATEHPVWAVSSVLVLVGLVGLILVMARTPEYRANIAAGFRSEGLKRIENLASVPLDIALALIPIVILLGLAPELEGALYFTLVVLLLLGAGWVLLDLVFSQRGAAHS